ncbi:hypothetical protein CI105_08590 [Candidatus Izimaplasma bacterium ZiA1]|uniref:hypothetical protein n=1 Tax=Candidatus Izimoplasma sp. ZiA1 TaxID=2024899 RepID=UPI000BAA805E|nr:hypothetical protein CI105_08590 [Candidatus Izimaplasma bacterium ZiA1]
MKITDYKDELYFFDRYVHNFKKFEPVMAMFDYLYDEFINVYDVTRKDITKIKTGKDIVLYTFLYNLSSSASSLLKDYLLDIRSLTEPLMIRNIIETIVIFNTIWKHENRDKYMELFFLHHYLQEYNFIVNHNVKIYGESVSPNILSMYELAMKKFVEFHNVKPSEANKIFQKRMGWAYRIIPEKNNCKITDLVRLSEDIYLKEIYLNKNLNSIIHLRDFDFNIDGITLVGVFKLVEVNIDKLCRILNIRRKKKTVYQLSNEFSETIYRNNIEPIYKPLYEKFGLNDLYKQTIKKMRKNNDLNDFFKASTRFEFESKAYSAGYSRVFEMKVRKNLFVFDESERLFNHVSCKEIHELHMVMLNMESDLAFGFENEYKLKYRYFVDLLIYVFNGSSVQSSFENFISQKLRSCLDEVESNHHFSLYHESCNFVHPNVYGYYGQYSRKLEYINGYYVSIMRLYNVFYYQMLSRVPLSTKVYNEHMYATKLFDDKINLLLKRAKTYNQTV